MGINKPTPPAESQFWAVAVSDAQHGHAYPVVAVNQADHAWLVYSTRAAAEEKANEVQELNPGVYAEVVRAHLTLEITNG